MSDFNTESFEIKAELSFREHIRQMKEILKREDYVPVPPAVMNDPYYKMTYLIKEEIRKHKWNQGTEERELNWEEAREEWTRKHEKNFTDYIDKMMQS